MVFSPDKVFFLVVLKTAAFSFKMRMRCTKAGQCGFVAEVEVLSFSWFLPPEGLTVLNPRLRQEPRVPVVLGMMCYLLCVCSRFFFFCV